MQGRVEEHSPFLAIEGVKSKMLFLYMLHCLCRLYERHVRAEDIEKFLFHRVLGAEPLDGLAIKRLSLIEPLGHLEYFLEIRKILIVDLLK